jgi:glutathione S-transferase
MITLHQPPPPGWPDSPNVSPFCAKLETYLRMVNLPYEVKRGNPLKAPKGKIPYIEDNGLVLGDSGFIIDYLKKTYGDPLDQDLDARTAATGHVLRRMVEESTFFAVAHIRWSRDEPFEYLRRFFIKFMPPVIGPVMIKMIRKRLLAAMRAQGTGRHSEAEIIRLMEADIDALSTALGEQPYFLGKEPTSLDATMYGFLTASLWVPWDGPEKRAVAKHDNLVRYCERMRDRYWR